MKLEKKLSDVWVSVEVYKFSANKRKDLIQFYVIYAQRELESLKHYISMLMGWVVGRYKNREIYNNTEP